VIDFVGERAKRVVLIGIDEQPISGARDRFFVRLAWLAASVWQERLLLDDGRWIELPEDIRDKPCSQTFKDAEFVLK
jgi:hypothetical protein